MSQSHSLSSFPGIPESPTDNNTPQDLIMTPAPAASAAPPPPTPLPWNWICHRCRIPYAFGVTRRCLECGHRMCTERVDGSLSSGSSGNRQPQPQPRRRRDRGGSCVSEFDFNGWERYAAWRRRHHHHHHQQLGQQGHHRGQHRLARERRMIDNVQNCSEDCNYPSECRYTRRRARDERIAKLLGNMSKKEEEKEKGPKSWILRLAAESIPPPPPSSSASSSSSEPTKTLDTGRTPGQEASAATSGDRDGRGGHDEAEQTLASRAVVESASSEGSDNDNGDSSSDLDSSLPGTGGPWPLPPAAGDEDDMTLVIPFSMPLVAPNPRAHENFSMHSSSSSQQQAPDDQAYDGDVESSSRASRVAAERSSRHRRTRSDASLSAPVPAPSRGGSRGSCWPLPALPEEPEDYSSSSSSRSSRSYSSLLSRPKTRRGTRDSRSDGPSSPSSSSSSSHSSSSDSTSRHSSRGHSRTSSSPPATRSNSRGNSADDDLAELMRFRSAFFKGEF
ncbi:hypothetical protein GGTG_07571 [Gaeumannomyces tritici R3-111a-1]|uniref:Uncharacterized protein n=1 Tax=Gaeumannomyces tritici (strain R3-111a-1) TaxID=644352 RepID=J3P223_GAET3|nr:hypothetical protein GGTG_07571 [Gaeumannomyces tritici R3-111a-1]EJT73715.1 hypothetical protein GGTG_07571 [Gaeumannomyces tritici R3-111a-1]